MQQGKRTKVCFPSQSYAAENDQHCHFVLMATELPGRDRCSSDMTLFHGASYRCVSGHIDDVGVIPIPGCRRSASSIPRGIENVSET